MVANNGIIKMPENEIKIYALEFTVGTAFYYNDDELENGKFKKRSNRLCEVCNYEPLSPTYVYIIDCLREADLLPDDYKLICCECYRDQIMG